MPFHEEQLAQRVAFRHLIHVAVRHTAPRHGSRVASRFDERCVCAWLEGSLMDSSMTRHAGLGNLLARAKKIWEMVRKTPRMFETLKKSLGVESMSDLPKMLREWGKKGLGVMRKMINRIKNSFPISLYFTSKGKMPSLTDLLNRIVGSSPAIEKALAKVRTNVVDPLDKLFEKYIPNLSRPLKAAAFTWIWLNVAEISWDLPSLIEGFTGKISLGALFASLPESGIGAILAMFGVGYHLLPITVIARVVWLVGKKYVSWKNGTLVVHWDKISGNRGVPAENLYLYAT